MTRTKLRLGYFTFIITFILILIFLFIYPGWSSHKTQKINLYMFYSSTCEHCEWIKNDFLPTLQSINNLSIKYFNIEELDNYEKLVALEKRFNRSDLQVLVIIFGNSILNGENEIREKLEVLINNYQSNQQDINVDLIYPDKIDNNNQRNVGQEKVYLAYFFSQGCKRCSRVEYDLIYLKGKYKNLIVKEFNIYNNLDKQLNEAIGQRLKIPESKRLLAPSIFIGEDYLITKDIILERLEGLILQYSKKAVPPIWEISGKEKNQAKVNIIERFKSIPVSAVLLAGFLDGINPCAFATIIFFISYLAYIGRKKGELLAVGFSFTIAVYLTYLAVGLGAYTIFDKAKFLPMLSKIVYILTAMLAFILSIYNFRDFLKIRQGDLSEMTLQLPNFLKKRIHKIIREKIKLSNYIIAAFASGFMVSFLELACTGQMYFPTIIFVNKIPNLHLKAKFYIVLYNLMFITPLITVFLVVYFGVSSVQLTEFMQRHTKGIKLSTAIFFFILATVLIINL